MPIDMNKIHLEMSDAHWLIFGHITDHIYVVDDLFDVTTSHNYIPSDDLWCPLAVHPWTRSVMANLL